MGFKTILVATDFSEHSQRAFERAHELAEQINARLFVLHVQTENTLRTAIKEGLLSEARTDEEIQTALTELINQRFAQLCSGRGTSSVPVETVTRRGDADSVIPAFAEEIQADLIAIGRRGAGLMQGVRSAIHGSVANDVIRKAPCPIMVVRREHVGTKQP